MRTATPVTTHNVHICFVHGTANEKPIWSDKEGIGMLARKTSERRINLAIVEALTISICTPMAWAASCTSRNAASATEVLLD